jgi:HlyD family type I secretion membrane fusion protein
MKLREAIAKAKPVVMRLARDAYARLRALVLGPETPSNEPFAIGRVLRLSASVLVGFLVLFALWAAVVPLDSAVMAQGVVAVESKRKKVQHLEGGILVRVAVRDGAVVKAGQVLAVLNQTDSAAALNVLLSEQDSILAQEARLRAEMNGDGALNFPQELQARAKIPAASAAMEGQARLFQQRSDSLQSEIAILENRRGQYLQIVEGLEAQLAAVKKQTALIEEEQAAFQALYDKGLAPLPRLLAVKRARAGLDGQRGELISSIAENRLRASEVDMEILNLRNTRLDKAGAELREVQKRRFELADRIKAAHGQLTRMTIRAPSDGVVVASTIHSPGQVVRPGDTLLEIVPQHDRLIVEAQLKPDDADNVRPGIVARVRLIPFKAKFQPVVEGKVRSVSADRLDDPATGAAYYLAEIELDRNAVAEALDGEVLQPGLPAEVMISLGSHTALEYLVAPMNRRLQQAMREE